MNRRTVLSLGGGVAITGLCGCLERQQGGDREAGDGTEPEPKEDADGADDEENEADDGENEADDTERDPEAEYIPMEDIRDAACTPVPADEAELEYTKAEFERVKAPLLAGTTEREADAISFVFVGTNEEAQSRLNPELEAEVWSFVEETNFDEQVLLVWDWKWTNASEEYEVIGVTRPDPETVRAYVCQYGSAGGTSAGEYTFLVRVDVPQKPQRAELTYREASGHREEDGITTREKQFESG